MPRILLADDHALMRRGMRSLLEAEEDWEVCAEAATGREAVDLAVKLNPDVAVLDLSMPELTGLEAAKEILQKVPQVEVFDFHHARDGRAHARSAQLQAPEVAYSRPISSNTSWPPSAPPCNTVSIFSSKASETLKEALIEQGSCRSRRAGPVDRARARSRATPGSSQDQQGNCCRLDIERENRRDPSRHYHAQAGDQFNRRARALRRRQEARPDQG